MSKRLPSPWSIIEHSESFEVRAANGIKIAFVYFEDEITRRQLQHRMTREDALYVAQQIAGLPEKPDPT